MLFSSTSALILSPLHLIMLLWLSSPFSSSKMLGCLQNSGLLPTLPLCLKHFFFSLPFCFGVSGDVSLVPRWDYISPLGVIISSHHFPLHTMQWLLYVVAPIFPTRLWGPWGQWTHYHLRCCIPSTPDRPSTSIHACWIEEWEDESIAVLIGSQAKWLVRKTKQIQQGMG